VTHLDWAVLVQYRGLLLDGLLATVELSALSILLSLVLGILLGFARSFLPPSLSWIATCYVEFFRNIPPIVQFFFWYFAAALDVFRRP